MDLDKDPSGTSVPELPTVIAVLSKLSNTNPVELEERTLDRVDARSFDAYFASQSPEIDIEIPSTIPGSADKTMSVKLKFKGIGEIGPKALAENIEPLKPMLKLLAQIREARAKVGSSSEIRKQLQELFKGIMSDATVAESLRKQLPELRRLLPEG